MRRVSRHRGYSEQYKHNIYRVGTFRPKNKEDVCCMLDEKIGDSEENSIRIIIQESWGKKKTTSAKDLRCYILGIFKKQQQQVDQIVQTTIDDHEQSV